MYYAEAVESSCESDVDEKKTGRNENQPNIKVEVVGFAHSWLKRFKMSYIEGWIVKANNPQLIGLLLMAGAGVFLTLGNVIVQYIHKITDRPVSAYQILFMRSIVQLLFTVIFMFYGRVHPYGNDKKNILSLLLMGIAETCVLVFLYLALERMPVADATVIQFTAPVFTLAFSFLCFRRGCSLFDSLCGCLSFVGVVVMTRPVLLFQNIRSHKAVGTTSHVPAHHGKIIDTQPGDGRYVLGAGFALLAAIMLSSFFILNKMVGKKVDLTLTIFYPSIFGIVCAPPLQAIFHESVYIDGNWKVWTYLIVVGLVSFVGMMFVAESLQLEDAGPASLIRNLDAVYAFILQYFLLSIKPHWLSLVGAGIVLLATSLLAINRTVVPKYDLCKCEKKEQTKDEDDEEHKFLLKGEDTQY